MSEEIKVTGEIIFIGEKTDYSEKFSKRLLVIEEKKEKYPQQFPIDFVNNNIPKLDGFKTGDMVNVYINLRGRHWKDDKWFASFEGWRIATNVEATSVEQQQIPDLSIDDEENSDLPF